MLPDRNVPKNIGKPPSKEPDNKDKHDRNESYQDDSKNWSRNGNNGSGGYNRSRNTDEDEILAIKRRQQHQVLTTAAERAKQRKEEEEKKYLEAKLKSKRDKDQEDSQGTISPSIVPPQPITPAPIPVPDWEKEKDPNAKADVGDENRSASNKNSREGTGSDFRQMTQIEAKNFVRKDNRNTDRGNSGYSRQMQNLPPRLQKKQQLRNNSSPQPPMSYAQYEPRWINPGQNVTKTSPTSSLYKMRGEWEGSDKERDDDRTRYNNEDCRRGTSNRSYSELGRKSSDTRYSDDGRDARNQDYDYKKEKDDNGKWEKSSKLNEKEDVYDNHVVSRQSSDEWHSDRHDKYRDEKPQDRYERPQRPDSRDSRASRDSRHSRESMRDSEPREHLGSWAESIAYEERKKEAKEDRRQVPGPITKEKIEADEKQNEKRNLTQLKKGAIPPPVSERKNENANEKSQDKDSHSWGNQNKDYDSDISKAWADDVSTSASLQDTSKHTEVDGSKKISSSEQNTSEMKEEIDLKKSENTDGHKDKDDKRIHPAGRNRPNNPRSQPWERNNMYCNWYKKSKGPRSVKTISKGNDWQCTDSDGSIDEVSCSNDSCKDDKIMRNSQKSPKPGSNKKIEKDDRNKDIVKSDKPDSKGDNKMDKLGERKMDKYLDSGRRETYEPRGKTKYF